MPDTPRAIPEHYRRQFSDQWEQQIQQADSKFSDAGMLDSTWTAKEKVFTDLSKVEFTETTGQRFGSTNAQEIGGGKRKGFKRKFDCAVKFDQYDKEFLENMGLPDSEVMQAMRMAWNRRLDDIFIDAAIAQSIGGAEPYITPLAFPVSQVVPVNYVKPQAALGSNSGMTIWKLLETKTRFEKLDLDLDREEVCLAISPEEEQQLMLYVESAPNETWAKMVAAWFERKEAKLLGLFKVIKTNRLPLNSSTDVRTCVAFCKKGFTLSSDSFDIKMDILATEKHALQIASYGQKGAVRRYDERVIHLPCDRTP